MGVNMAFSLSFAPLVALIAGILILIGLIGIFGVGNPHIV